MRARRIALPGSVLLPELVARTPATVYAKLLVAFLSIVLMFLVLGAVGLWVLAVADQRAAHLVALERKISAYRQLQHNTTGQLYAISSAFFRTDQRSLDSTLRKIARFDYDFDRARFVGTQEAELLRDFESDYERLTQTGTVIVELIREGRIDRARSIQELQLVPLAQRLERLIYTLVDKAEAEMLEGRGSSGRAYRASQMVVVAVSLLTISLALVLGYAISRSLIDPVSEMRARLRRIARGDFSGRLEVSNRDELGELAEAVNLMSHELDRLYRELEAASQHKSAFLANMSHELRTPMTAIIGFNRIVMRRCKGLLPEKQYDNLQKVAISADQLLALINGVLDLSKIEAGRMEATPRKFDLGAVLTMCTRTVEPLLEGKAVELIEQIPSRLPVMFTDQDKVRQVVINLLSNAAKFTDRGSIRIAASAHGDQVSIAVTDTGIGIPEAQLPRIFEEFIQVDSGSTRPEPGTGLGLAIAKRFVELMGGAIEVESTHGVGSAFTIRLPVVFNGKTQISPEQPGTSVDEA